MKKAEKSHKLPVFGARSFVEEETDGDDVIFINHQKFVKRTVDDVTAYFADGTTAGAARLHIEAMKPKKHAAKHAEPKHEEPKPAKNAIGPPVEKLKFTTPWRKKEPKK